MEEERGSTMWQLKNKKRNEKMILSAQTDSLLKMKEVRRLAEHVSVSGIEEALGTRSNAERRVWQICLVIVLTLMIVESVVVGLRWKFEDSVVFSDLELSGGRPEFPNISICVPRMANKSKFQEIMYIPHDVQVLMKRTNVTIQQLVDYAGSVSVVDLNDEGVKPSLALVADKVIDAMYRKMPYSLSDFLETMASPCSDILSNCAFEGREFECCSIATFSYAKHAHCYYIEVNRASHLSFSDAKANIDRTRSDVTIFHVNISTNWDIAQFLDGVSPAGYYVHIDQASPFSDPVMIPTNMDATIVLSPAVRVRQRTACEHRAGSLYPYFDTYDPDGYNCMVKSIMETTSKQAACDSPLLTFKASNDTICSAALMSFCSKMMRGSLLDESKLMGMDMTKMEKEMSNFVKTMLNSLNCRPLCTRWSYSVLSASYNSIHSRNGFNMDDSTINASISWSRIQILLPSSSYVVHEEQLSNPLYLAVCEIGGLMGVFAGFSMVTFLQLIFYGPLACRGLMRRRRINASSGMETMDPVTKGR